MMRFLRWLWPFGRRKPAPEPPDTAALIKWWQYFIQAGGVITLSDWERMTAEERAIVIHLRQPGPDKEAKVLSKAADDVIMALQANPMRPGAR